MEFGSEQPRHFDPAGLRAEIVEGLSVMPRAYVLSRVNIDGTPASGRVTIDISGQNLVPEAIDPVILQLGRDLEDEGLRLAYSSENDQHIRYTWVRQSPRARAHMRRVY